jgi:hypothetical protein
MLKQNTPEWKDDEFVPIGERNTSRYTLPPVLEVLFGTITTGSAIGGALMGNLISPGEGALIGAIIGGAIGFMTEKGRKDGHTSTN